MRRLAFALLACTAWTAAAGAMEEPQPGKGKDDDPRVCSASYSATNVIHIKATAPEPVQIVVQQGEQVASFAGLRVGRATKPEDVKAIHDWFLTDSGNSIVLQPFKAEPSSLLFIDTVTADKQARHYRFQLDATGAAEPGKAATAAMTVAMTVPGQAPPPPPAPMCAAINMVYPEVVAAQRRELAVQRAAERARLQALAGQRAAEARLVQAATDAGRNWSYQAQNIDATDDSCFVIGPRRDHGISDDGVQTRLLFAPHAALPVPYAVDQDGHPAVVQHAQAEVPDGTVMTLGVVAKRIVLRRGLRACAFNNLGYDPQGHSPGTGTVSPAVVRELRQ